MSVSPGAQFAQHLSQFEPISLDQLTSSAALLTRVDRKYALTAAQAREVLAELPAGSRVLTIAGQSWHGYQSTYFDTPAFDSFYSGARRWRRRFKVRLRSYTDSGLSFVEVKTRGSRGATVKERLEYCPDKARKHRLDLRALAWVEAQLVRRQCVVRAVELEPSLHVSYTRSTLLLPGQQSARATIDCGLRWMLPQGSPYRVDDLVIVETKSGARPSELDRVLWRHGVRPGRVSKYATALAVLRPHLPSNRWNRTIGRHFLPAGVDDVSPAALSIAAHVLMESPSTSHHALAS